MAGRKTRDACQYGDFQTPEVLAKDVCALLSKRGVTPEAVIEPTCGRGAFLDAAKTAFPTIRLLLGVEINPAHVAEARARLGAAARIEQGDFFAVDWTRVLGLHSGPWLILGNPPWVTNAALGTLKSANLPVKTNFQAHKGLDAITGKANFDISEWMLLEQVKWLKTRTGCIAVLVKTAVARKVLKHVWRRKKTVGRAAMYKIDAARHFGAAVDACLFVLPVGHEMCAQECDVFEDFESDRPTATIGIFDGMLVSDIRVFSQHANLIGSNRDYIWRSGVKHDCAKVMELVRTNGGSFENGMGERVALEPD